jgi:hypothetical protein
MGFYVVFFSLLQTFVRASILMHKLNPGIVCVMEKESSSALLSFLFLVYLLIYMCDFTQEFQEVPGSSDLRGP